MCAECHSTGVRKNYDAQTDRFATKWAEISVGCEACHGQGSNHVAWAHARQSWWPFGKQRRFDAMGLLVRYRRAQQHQLAARSEHRKLDAERGARDAAQRGRDLRLCHARRGQLSEIGCRDIGCPTPTSSRRSAAGSITPTGRCATRSTTTARSSRARCLRPASPAAIATIRTAASRGTAETISACNVMRQTNSPARRTIGMRRWTRRSAARPATCRSAPIWASIGGMITVSASRVPICPRSSTRRTPATIATPIGRRNGPPQQSKTGTDQTARAFRPSRRRWPRAGPSRADASAVAGCGGYDRAAPESSAPRALTELTAYSSPGAIGRRGRVCRTPIRWCGSARSICSKRARRAIVADRFAAVVGSHSRRPHSGGLAACLGAHCAAARCDRPRFERAAEEFVAAQRLNADRPEARSALGTFPLRAGR